MKPIIIISFILCNYGCFAQNSVKEDKATSACTIVFFSRYHPEDRSIRLGNYRIFINDSLVGKVGQNRYLAVHTTPGNKIIAPQMDGKRQRKRSRKIEVIMEAGDTRYYEIIDPVPPFSFYLTLFEASEKFGEEQMKRLREQKK